MSYIRLANFFELYNLRGDTEETQGMYHNAMPGITLDYDDGHFLDQYLSFIYQGAAKNRTGDNLEAQLQVSVNEISSGIAVKARSKNAGTCVSIQQ